MFLLEKKNNKAILTIYGYVGGAYFDYRAVTSAIAELSREGFSQIDFHLHTYGGYVFDGNLIYNALASFKGEIDVFIDGVAASMGSIIMTAGTRIHIAENGFIMIHAPQGGADGTAKDLESYAKLLRMMEKSFKTRLMARTGKTEKEVSAWLEGGDNWFDADEAIAAKLVDGKFSPKTTDLATLDKTEVIALGAKGTFERFAALTNLQNSQNKKKDMDKKSLIARYGLTTVTEASSDEEVMAAIDAKIKASSDEAAAAKADLAKTQKTSIEAAVDSAIAAGKINKEKRAEYCARGEKIGLEELNAIFADMQVYQPISGQIAGKKPEGNAPTDRKGWDWDRYQKEAVAELEEMPKKDPATFKALFKAKYGYEPEL